MTARALLLGALAGLAVACAGAGATAREGHSALDEEVRRVSAEVGRLRGRTFRHEVPARTMSCPNASLRLLEIARAEGARCSPDIERAIVALGFMEHEAAPAAPGASRASRSDETAEDEASHPCGLAFYDQIRKEVVVVDGRSTADERAEVLAHELSHALQDQDFDLRARLRSVPRTASGDHDAEDLAVNAAINEGEATALELLYLWKQGAERSWIQGVGLDDPLAGAAHVLGVVAPAERERRLDAGLRSVLRGARLAWSEQRRLGAHFYFHALARFQYLAGCSFVAEAYRRGGWELVDRLRASPPTATAQILHPERYFDRLDGAVSVAGSEFIPSGRSTLLYENRLGELGTEIATESEAPGWRGDRYRVLARPDGATVVEARSFWKSPGDALVFLAHATRWLRSMSLSASSFDVIERRGSAVVLGAGIREEELGAFREANWKSRAGDLFAAESKVKSPTLGLRRRGVGGNPTCEMRLLEADERSKAEAVLKVHLDRSARGTVETDGRTWGLRSRPGGGFSWVEERSDGTIVVATGSDRANIDATRAALSRLSPIVTK
jgi:hypothetical protein